MAAATAKTAGVGSGAVRSGAKANRPPQRLITHPRIDFRGRDVPVGKAALRRALNIKKQPTRA
jgi:hypothetical protein